MPRKTRNLSWQCMLLSSRRPDVLNSLVRHEVA
jgi:hypothetical protein